MPLQRTKAGMAARKTLNVKVLYSTMHQALRSWNHIDVLGLDLFASLLLVRPYGYDLHGIDPLRAALKQPIARSLLDRRGSPMDPRYGLQQLTQTFLQTDLVRQL